MGSKGGSTQSKSKKASKVKRATVNDNDSCEELDVGRSRGRGKGAAATQDDQLQEAIRLSLIEARKSASTKQPVKQSRGKTSGGRPVESKMSSPKQTGSKSQLSSKSTPSAEHGTRRSARAASHRASAALHESVNGTNGDSDDDFLPEPQWIEKRRRRS